MRNITPGVIQRFVEFEQGSQNERDDVIKHQETISSGFSIDTSTSDSDDVSLRITQTSEGKLVDIAPEEDGVTFEIFLVDDMFFHIRQETIMGPSEEWLYFDMGKYREQLENVAEEIIGVNQGYISSRRIHPPSREKRVFRPKSEPNDEQPGDVRVVLSVGCGSVVGVVLSHTAT